MAGKKGAQRLTGEARIALRDDLAKQYQDGASIRALKASSGLSYGAVHKLLSEAGVRMRSRGFPNSRPTGRPDLSWTARS